MKKSQLAVQLYTLRDYLKTPGAVDRAFAKIREIGYEAVQISGVAAPLAAVKKAADNNGLVICATHAATPDLLGNRAKVADELAMLGCKHTAFSCVSDFQIIDRGAVLEFAGEMEKAAQELNQHGLTFSYHNHNMEFGKIDGEYILDLIYANAPHLLAEIDTYWVQYGGCDPAEWIEKYAGRQILFHLKDFRPLFFTATTAPVGTGNLKWQKIIPAAEKAGAQWFIVEQDSCAKNPFDSLKDSYDYLMKNFVRG